MGDVADGYNTSTYLPECQTCGRSGWALAASWEAAEAPRGCDECYLKWARNAMSARGAGDFDGEWSRAEIFGICREIGAAISQRTGEVTSWKAVAGGDVMVFYSGDYSVGVSYRQLISLRDGAVVAENFPKRTR